VNCSIGRHAEHLLDWVHVTMRITVMANMAKGLRSPPPDDDLVGSPRAVPPLARHGQPCLMALSTLRGKASRKNTTKEWPAPINKAFSVPTRQSRRRA